MKKKLLSLFMACAMILALAAPAFAASPYFDHPEGDVSDQLTQSVTIATRTFVPTVKLTLPTLTEPSIVLNPYKIKYTGADDLLLNGYAVADSDEQVKQVISPVYTIKNETNVKLNYAVAVTGTVEGGVTFSNDAVSLTEKNKKAHVALMVANKEVSVASADNAASTPQNIVGFGATTGTGALPGLSEDDIETQYLKTSEAKFTMPKSLADAGTTANYLAFQFKGDLTRQPTPNSWTADDKIGAVITFTFTPESAQDFAITTALDVGSSATTALSAASVTDATAVTTAFYGSAVPATWKAPATQAWAMHNAGAFEASVAPTTGIISLKAAKLKEISGLSATAKTVTDTVVVSFTDTDGIPRTVSVPLTFSITS